MEIYIKPRYPCEDVIEIDDSEIESCCGDKEKIKVLVKKHLAEKNIEDPNLWEFSDIDDDINNFFDRED